MKLKSFRCQIVQKKNYLFKNVQKLIDIVFAFSRALKLKKDNAEKKIYFHKIIKVTKLYLF